MSRQIMLAPQVRQSLTRLHSESTSPLINGRSEARFNRIEFAGGVLSVHDNAFMRRGIRFSPQLNRSLCLGAIGLSSVTIQHLTGISRETTKSSRARLYRTLEVANMRGAVSLAYRTGFLKVEQPAPPLEPAISQRQAEAILAVTRNDTNRRAARDLTITEETLKSHLHHVNARIGAESTPGVITATLLCGAIALAGFGPDISGQPDNSEHQAQPSHQHAGTYWKPI